MELTQNELRVLQAVMPILKKLAVPDKKVKPKKLSLADKIKMAEDQIK